MASILPLRTAAKAVTLTSAVLTIDEIRQVVEELFQANKEYVQGFK
jgi:alpha-galactosidase/6-phospho-beta-glucosidase family protein